jgi:Inclusion body protein
MCSSIDVVIVIDTINILANYPDPSQDADNPTKLLDEFCFMIAQTADVCGGQATAHLRLKVQRNHPVRWRSLSMSGNAQQSAILYCVEPLLGLQAVDAPSDVERLIAAPLPILIDGHSMDPPSFTTVEQMQYFIHSKIVKPGTERFNIQFYITDVNEDGNIVTLGYFRWNPTITIK